MKRVLGLLLTLLLVGIMPAICFGDSFIRPPEYNVPGWQTSFPYQRNAYWDFTFDPTFGTPTTIPGAIYEGWLDPVLYEDDYVVYPPLIWNSSGTGIMPESENGLLPSLIIHFANVDNMNPVKRIYLEMRYDSWSPTNDILWVLPYINLPDGFQVVNSGYDVIPDDPINMRSILLTAWYEVQPNPPWEEIIFPFDYPFDFSGESYAWLEDIHIGTECVVPLPPAIIFLGSGLLAIGAVRRRFGRIG